ncbi:putative baseplate assembly protein [Streptomyces sp. ISL-36]|uniref:putative baseplate assembly protein n=1 Tax=Streptomyces sp. ISL-36 TaxID=2819182 RepID=UPI001BE86E8F|nr:putative baseplate assembly protein [Streptomyces sp. ISL-36]MBT2442697.1 putative baseplate assembly protein [Streptomyces sp. ISL-36]
MTGTDCGCGCGPAFPSRPATPSNPPGLDGLTYRVGVHGQFKAAMLRALGTDPVLRHLATRDDGDPVVALLDACGSMLDVLTFYQERIANEGFLRTATERLSVLELARMIGYELRPGVAASTALAFTLAEPTVPAPSPLVDLPASALAATTPEAVRLAVGTKAQSVPVQDTLPRTFETTEEVEGRPEWNAMRAVSIVRSVPKLGDTTLRLAGTSTGVAVGDVIVLLPTPLPASADPVLDWEACRITDLRTVERSGSLAEHTVATVESIRPVDSAHLGRPADMYVMRVRALVFGYNAVPWKALPSSLRVGEWVTPANADGRPGTPKFHPGLYADRQLSWAEAQLPADGVVRLDRVHPGIAGGSWVVLASPQQTEKYTVFKVTEESVDDFLMQAQVTVLDLIGDNITTFDIRSTTVYACPEPLEPAYQRVTQAVSGKEIELASAPPVLPPEGRLVAIRGTAARTGDEIAEVSRISSIGTGASTTLFLTEELTHSYLPDSVRVNANVAPATDGESRTETLGSGDGSVPFPRFTLLGKPLTYVSAPTPTGGLSTLTVRVDGVRWTEVPTLHGQPPDARVFLTRRDDDGTVTVCFGDGRTGARLPTGKDNVVAEYRIGTGRAGNVDARRISLPLSRPLGLQDVINPVAATGGADPEQLSQARRNVPGTALALDRIVSLRDYEDFARSFSGVGKARASARWTGERLQVRLVVATSDEQPVAPSSTLHAHLTAGIDAARHARHDVSVDTFTPRPFMVELGLRTAGTRVVSQVYAAVTDALVRAFSFAAREFGQPVAAGEVLAVTQSVDGVLGVEPGKLRFAGQAAEADVLRARPDEVLTLSAPHITLTDAPEPSL